MNFGRKKREKIENGAKERTNSSIKRMISDENRRKKMMKRTFFRRFSVNGKDTRRATSQARVFRSRPERRREGLARNGQKKEFVERKMNVEGGTGKFSVHIDQKQTNVSSSTGPVKVFIKNPSPSELPQDLLHLPGALVELPERTSRLPGAASQLTRGEPPRASKDSPLVLVRLPYDFTGASNWDFDKKR